MAVSGKCYLSLQNAGRSANRGECVQICRRGYEVTDVESGTRLLVDNKYIMSPRDLKTIGFIDIMMNAGVRVFKIEGRARGPEYVKTVVEAYNEAINAVLHDQQAAEGAERQFTPEAVSRWDEQLSTVFNRGFWDGYYQGAQLGEWCEVYGSKATEMKVYSAKCTKYFPKIAVGEFLVENEPLATGDKILVTGNSTGALIQQCGELRTGDGADNHVVPVADKGMLVALRTDERVRPGDRLYILRSRQLSSL